MDNVNHPEHYQGKHECIDEMIALFGVEAVKAFCRCNVYKYRYRADRKNGDEDIAKADWYMDKLMELDNSPEKEIVDNLMEQDNSHVKEIVDNLMELDNNPEKEIDFTTTSTYFK